MIEIQFNNGIGKIKEANYGLQIRKANSTFHPATYGDRK